MRHLPMILAAALMSTSAVAADDARPRLLVLEPSSEVVNKPTLNTIASLMLVELSKQHGLDVISASDVKRLAELEGEKQSMGCADTSCLAELAGAMGARYVVFGDVGQLGSLIILNLNLFDSSKATAVNRTTVQANGVEDLPSKLAAGLRELTAPLNAGGGAAAATTTTTETPPAVKGEPPSAALTYGLIGGGVAVALAGGGFDLLSPTSDDNGKLDGFDFIGPTVMVAGIGVAIAGVVLMIGGGDG
ncbi:MAG: hypothetical protein Q8O67_14965 [Deltaproteobacteria bacterium]|nr:hypothetical protein [Deltaproteobacteria bacterium]